MSQSPQPDAVGAGSDGHQQPARQADVQADEAADTQAADTQGPRAATTRRSLRFRGQVPVTDRKPPVVPAPAPPPPPPAAQP